jgi:hypothetical protein
MNFNFKYTILHIQSFDFDFSYWKILIKKKKKTDIPKITTDAFETVYQHETFTDFS